MLRSILILVVTIAVSPVMAASVSDFSGLHGCWHANTSAGLLQDSWSTVAGGMMFGHGVFIDPKGNTVGWGQMSVTPKNSGVQFGYSENGKAQELFDLTDFVAAEDGFTAKFSNGSPAGVSTVIYTLSGRTSLRVQVIGGEHDSFDLVMTRVSQTADCP